MLQMRLQHPAATRIESHREARLHLRLTTLLIKLPEHTRGKLHPVDATRDAVLPFSTKRPVPSIWLLLTPSREIFYCKGDRTSLSSVAIIVSHSMHIVSNLLRTANPPLSHCLPRYRAIQYAICNLLLFI